MSVEMMTSRFQYVRPRSLKDALNFLDAHGPHTSILAGGTDLMISIRRGALTPKFVMDVSRLEELRVAEKLDGHLSVGAALTYTEIMNDPTIVELAPVLALASSFVGSLQIRNVGTLGGNISNASPASDAVTALMVHDAQVEVLSAKTSRMVPLNEFITSPYRTTLKPGELITRLLLETFEKNYRFTFQRIARRRALSIARINLAAVGQIDSRGLISDFRLSVGSITPQPARMTRAEDILKGVLPDRNLVMETAKKVSQEMVSRSGVRPSTEYKRPAVEGLVIKSLTKIFLE